MLNVAALVEAVGIERVGFFTITTPDVCSYWTREGWEEAQSRFHSFMSRAFVEIFGRGARYAVVLEPQKRGAVHWHMVVECPGDIRTGFSFDQARAGSYTSASPVLRRLWSEIRSRVDAYGLGRTELLPVRSCKEALADYVGKYIAKCLTNERFSEVFDGVKRPCGMRRVRYSRGPWRAASSRFAWVDSGRRWRAAVAHVASELGITSMEEWTTRFGPRWAHFLGDSIIQAYETRQSPE